nr:hypothetical protein BaRGS_025485 [Batillaria attramentaria]
MTRMQLNDHKAGMQGLDKEHINQIIYEASKGSRFFENERRKEEQVRLRIQEQEKNRRKITESELQRGKAEADALVAQLEASRDLSQSIVHVDMDAFYAAVEMRDDPSLRDKPMAVGGIGMLVGFIGRKLCPQLILVPLNFPKYHEISGIGRVTEQLLGALGIVTCSDLTFGELCRPEELYSKCLDLCHSLASDLAEEQLMGKTISLKLKTTDFQVRTRAQTISNFTNDAETIFSVAKGILRVRMSKLAPVTDCPQRADWTLESFNHHVDACLNRDAISQILREQRGKEEQCKKRESEK